MMRHEPSVVVKGQVAHAPKAIKHGQQAGMFLVDARSNEFDDRDVVPGLAPDTKAMTEHESEGRLEHRFIRLLKASLFINGENFMSRRELLVGLARKRSICAQSAVCDFSFFIRMELSAEYAYCARRFPERHPCGRAGTRLLSKSVLCS